MRRHALMMLTPRVCGVSISSHPSPHPRVARRGGSHASPNDVLARLSKPASFVLKSCWCRRCHGQRPWRSDESLNPRAAPDYTPRR